MTKAKRRATLTWTGDGDVFTGEGERSEPVTVDGDSRAGPSPMETLLLSLAACMAVDIKMILEKGRVAVEDLKIGLEGERAEEPPRRYTRIVMDVCVRGPEEADAGKVDRAVQLSRDKYCSVFHTLQPDLETEIRTHLE